MRERGRGMRVDGKEEGNEAMMESVMYKLNY